MLEAIDLVETGGSASLRFFNVTAVASVGHPDAGPLVYSYRMIGDDWNVLVESDGESDVVFSAPTTRDFEVEVTVADSFGSSVVCDDNGVLCPVVETLDLDAADVVADVLEQVDAGNVTGGGKSAFLSGIDTVTDSVVEIMQLLELTWRCWCRRLKVLWWLQRTRPRVGYRWTSVFWRR